MKIGLIFRCGNILSSDQTFNHCVSTAYTHQRGEHWIRVGSYRQCVAYTQMSYKVNMPNQKTQASNLWCVCNTLSTLTNIVLHTYHWGNSELQVMHTVSALHTYQWGIYTYKWDKIEILVVHTCSLIYSNNVTCTFSVLHYIHTNDEERDYAKPGSGGSHLWTRPFVACVRLD